MNDILNFLQNRNSAPKLAEPAPDADQLQEILKAAVRAPDHAWLRPWRFISIAGDRRLALGEALEQALLQRCPDADQAARDKARNSTLRAPMLLVVVARLSSHPKVPELEQRLSAGCAAHAVLLGAEALGYAGIWRTGDAAFDPNVGAALGLDDSEEVIAFLYLGTRAGPAKPLPAVNAADFLTSW